MFIHLALKFQLDILKGFRDMVNLLSNTLQSSFYTLSSVND